MARSTLSLPQRGRLVFSCLLPAIALLLVMPDPAHADVALSQAQVDERIAAGVARVLAQISEPRTPERELDLVEFSGQRPDAAGTHDFQSDIARALSTLAAHGGGSLRLPYPGGYTPAAPELVYRVRGPIELRSGTALRLGRGIRLRFEFDPASYRPGGRGVLSRYEGTFVYTHSPLIRAFNAENIAIEGLPGEGPLPIIDGDGARWRAWEVAGNEARGKSQDGRHASYQQVKEANNAAIPIPERRFDEEFLRPCLMEFLLCRQLRVQDVKLVNSPFWTIHPLFSENLVFRRINFETLVANNDGIDPESSRYVLIEDVNFHNGDDNIAIKSGRDREGREGALVAGTEMESIVSPFIQNGRIGGPTHHVLVRRCTFRGHYALCIGSEMSGGAHDIYALDNASAHSVRMGFYIKGGRNRGGIVSDVFVRNLRLNEVTREIVRLIPNYDNDRTSPYPSKFRDIVIENMTVRKAGMGIRVFGWPDATIDDVTLRGITVGEIADGPPLEYNNVNRLILDRVVVGGRDVSGNYSLADPDVPTPR